MGCEVLLIVASIAAGSDLRWHCSPDLMTCWSRATEEMDAIDWRGRWQCIEIGSLVDYTRGLARPEK